MALPLDVFDPSGISKILIQKHLPFWVKNSMYWWFVPTNICSKKSSFLVVEPFWPTPPLFCILYSTSGVLLMYPAWDIVTTTLSSGIISSSLKLPPAYWISDRLSSPYFSFTSSSSALIISILRSLLLKISFKSKIVFLSSLNSSLNLLCSRPVSCLSLISTMALDCISVKLYFEERFTLASSGVFDFLIMLITSSILSEATIIPSKMCALSSAFFNSNSVLFTTISCLCSTKWWIRSFKFNNFGLPLTNAMLLTLKDDCRGVNLYSLFKTMFGMASLLRM